LLERPACVRAVSDARARAPTTCAGNRRIDLEQVFRDGFRRATRNYDYLQ